MSRKSRQPSYESLVVTFVGIGIILLIVAVICFMFFEYKNTQAHIARGDIQVLFQQKDRAPAKVWLLSDMVKLNENCTIIQNK